MSERSEIAGRLEERLEALQALVALADRDLSDGAESLFLFVRQAAAKLPRPVHSPCEHGSEETSRTLVEAWERQDIVPAVAELTFALAAELARRTRGGTDFQENAAA